MRKRTALFPALIAALLLTACSGAASQVISSSNDAQTAENSKKIVLNGDSIKADSGVSVSGSTAVIEAAGNYAVSGVLKDGAIKVNTGDDAGKVNIILNGADITNLTSSAIVVEKASKVNIVLEKNTENRVTSGSAENPAADIDDASGAAISSKDDLDIKGEGKLEVFGYINNGIACKNDIDIESGTVSVYAVNNALRGSDSVEIKGGEVKLQAGNDGIKTLTADKEGKGVIEISGGSVYVLSEGDGVSAATELRISGGEVEVITSGDADNVSCKGLKAERLIEISGAKLMVDSRDNALQTNGSITISGGSTRLVSDKNGIRIKEGGTLNISGGELLINSAKKCFDLDGDMSCSGGEVLAIGYYKNGAPEPCAGLHLADNSLAKDAVYKFNTVIKSE